MTSLYIMKKNLLFLLIILCACGRHSPSSLEKISSLSGSQDPPQFGIPFSHVPDTRDVILYQVNIRAFSPQGNFRGVDNRLDSIKALGVNVVYLMPTYPVGILKAKNSTYCIKDYYGVNQEFGNLNDLRALVEDAHKRNLAVMLDWVANHTSWDNDWIRNKDWYEQDSAGNIIFPPEGWEDVAQLNFNNTAMRLAMIRAMKYWVLAANIDGYRCDFVDGPPVDFWKQAIDTLRQIKNHHLLLLAEGQRGANYDAGFDYNFGFKFYDKLKKIYSGRLSVKAIDSLNTLDYKSAKPGQMMVRYLTNHDVNSSDGTPVDLFGGQKGSMAAFVVAAYMKSIPMIYSGQEVAIPYRIVFPFTKNKINWSLNPAVTREYKRVLAFRNNSPAVRRGDLSSYSTNDICAFTKKLDQEEVWVISNLRNKTIQYTVPVNLRNTSWHQVFNEHPYAVKSGIMMEPCSYLVLKRKIGK